MTDNKQVKFSPSAMAYAKEIIARYPEGKQKSALIPLLHLVQDENEGWLSVDSMNFVADMLQIQHIEAYEVASFYSMFNLKKRGNCLLEVCQTSSCWLMGAEDVVRHIEKRLSIKNGETTADGLFSLKTVECLGACGYAPMMQVGEQFHEHLTIAKVDALIEQFRGEYASTNTKYVM
jgi:NADH-quinone oxidoreductase subunit E